MSINSIVQFLVIGREHTARENLVADFERLLADYRIPYYGVISQPKPSEDPISLVLAGRWPEGWPEHYIEKKYVLTDPTIRYLPHADSGYAWRSTLKFFEGNTHFQKMRKMLDDAKKFGLKQGYVFPVHSRQGLIGNMTIGGEELELTPVEITLFDQVAKVMLLSLLDLSGMSRVEPLAQPTDVTQRELEVLSYLADGLTSQEISKVLKISSHTVDWHMNSIQEKLHARNRQHAVALAFRLGLVI